MKYASILSDAMLLFFSQEHTGLWDITSSEATFKNTGFGQTLMSSCHNRLP